MYAVNILDAKTPPYRHTDTPPSLTSFLLILAAIQWSYSHLYLVKNWKTKLLHSYILYMEKILDLLWDAISKNDIKREELTLEITDWEEEANMIIRAVFPGSHIFTKYDFQLDMVSPEDRRKVMDELKDLLKEEGVDNATDVDEEDKKSRGQRKRKRNIEHQIETKPRVIHEKRRFFPWKRESKSKKRRATHKTVREETDNNQDDDKMEVDEGFLEPQEQNQSFPRNEVQPLQVNHLYSYDLEDLSPLTTTDKYEDEVSSGPEQRTRELQKFVSSVIKERDEEEERRDAQNRGDEVYDDSCELDGHLKVINHHIRRKKAAAALKARIDSWDL
ncbi:hypothetical protein L208DRAFT_1518705 [Tricholoma matsutake]|nr:hypothetical protein L208DRAFT_1518705 [Tricholoma matsutake 945]